MSRAEDLPPRPCATCGVDFRPYRNYQLACSRSCANRLRRESGPQSPWAMDRECVCRNCARTFIARTTTPHRLCSSCRPVAEAAAKARKNAARRLESHPDPTERRKKNLANNLRQYRITLEQFETMRDAQGNRCAICGDPPDPNGVKAASRLHVDHDHTTGAIRDLLCGRCNQGVGFFRDDPGLLQAAAAYITRHRVVA